METITINAPVRISSLEGAAYIVLQDGTQQPVKVGQILPAGTVLLVDTNAQINYIPVADGVEEAPAIADTSTPFGEISELQAAILAGFDPTELFAAPAAGQGADGAVGQGSGNGGFIAVDRIGGFTQPVAGFDTNFNPISFENIDLIQPEETDSIPELVIIFDPPPTPSDDQPQLPDGGTFVEESALDVGGSNAVSDNETATGHFDIDTGTDKLAKLEVRLANGDWVDVTGGGQIAGQYGTLEVTLVEGVYQWSYTLNGPADHPGIDKVAEDDILKDLFEVRVTDDDGDQALAGFTVNVLDDGPIANDDSFQVNETGLDKCNLVLVIDTSGSMGWIIDGPGVPGETGVDGSPNRLELAKAALINLINSYQGITSELNITVIDFGGSVKNTATNMTVEEAIAHIESLTAGGTTNYSDPLDDAQAILDAQLVSLPDYEHKVYFLSDGYPNAGTAPAGWQVFVDANGIDVIAVGISIPESAVAELDKVGNKGDTTLIIDDPFELDDALQDTVPTTQLSGNVLANDVSGADGFEGVLSVSILVSDATPYEGQDGVTIEDQGDGTFLVTYAVPESGTVEIITEQGSTLTMARNGDFTYNGPGNVNKDTTETFTYTMADNDGDTSSAKLSITVQDNDTKIKLLGLDVEGGELTLDEQHLPLGSDPQPDQLVKSGTFSFEAEGTVKDLIVGGVKVLDNGVYQGDADGKVVIVDDAGRLLVITGYDAQNRTFSYSYTLKDSTQLHQEAGRDTLVEQFLVFINDTQGAKDTAVLDINIVDDITIIHEVDNLSVANAAATYPGHWDYSAGADGLLIDMNDIDAGINLSLLTGLDGVILERQDLFNDGQYLGERLTAYVDSNGDGKVSAQEPIFFTLDMHVDGSYEFNLITPNPVMTESLSFDKRLPGNFDELWAEQILKAELTTDIRFSGSAAINPSQQGIGVGSNLFDKGETLKLEFFQGDKDANTSTHPTVKKEVDKLTLTFKFGGSTSSATMQFLLLAANGDVLYDFQQTVNEAAGGFGSITIDASTIQNVDGFYAVQINHIEGDDVRLFGTDTSVSILPEDQLLAFSVTTVDSDNDSASHQFSIVIDGDTQHLTGTADGEILHASGGNKAYIQGLGGNDTLIGAGENDVLVGGDDDDTLKGEGGDDILIGGLGNNILTGDEGADVFVFNQPDAGSLNIISDFEKGIDTLDLRDLLSGEQNGVITDYLSVTKSGNDTLFTVSPGGDGGQLQQIQLQGVDLLSQYGASDSAHLLQLMQEDQSLIIDK
ncbi:retention module-containing protein [Zobellella maritima]|uniref:retention module-containing protein n=1 Tax=Zobellella maritima TaxID=2059725 RepID=UPI000E30A67C|nr:retention module-containing protein [Zobellella maritima]